MTHEERVEAIRKALPGDQEWDEREAALLALAACQAADLDRLEADVAKQGVRVEGRNGPVLNQALAEARQGRVALGRLLGLIDIPESVAPASVHGRKAAQARWEKAA